MWLLLPTTFLAFFGSILALPCAQVTHSECGDDSANLLKELDTPDMEGCHHVCWGVGERCKFFIFDSAAFGRGNCRIYSASLSTYILYCNALAGPATDGLETGCDLTNPPDGDVQILRSGNCDYGRSDENVHLNSWQHCQASCQAIGSCTYWQFAMEHKLCSTFSTDKPTCSWQFAPRDPSPCRAEPDLDNTEDNTEGEAELDNTEGEAHQEL